MAIICIYNNCTLEISQSQTFNTVSVSRLNLIVNVLARLMSCCLCLAMYHVSSIWISLSLVLSQPNPKYLVSCCVLTPVSWQMSWLHHWPLTSSNVSNVLFSHATVCSRHWDYSTQLYSTTYYSEPWIESFSPQGMNSANHYKNWKWRFAEYARCETDNFRRTSPLDMQQNCKKWQYSFLSPPSTVTFVRPL